MSTVLAASVSRDDVAAAITAAADGDIVQIPAGTGEWSSGISISKAITLAGTTEEVATIASIGTGYPATVTTNAAHGLSDGDMVWLVGVVGGETAKGNPYINAGYRIAVTGLNTFTIRADVSVAPSSGTGSVIKNATIIEDDGSSGQKLITWTCVANKLSRITAIQFRNGSRGVFEDGVIPIYGSNVDNRRIRVDHCGFNNLNGFQLKVEGALGVVDNNVFYFTGSNYPAYVYHRNWNGGSYSDKSWTADSNFGSEEFIFFERNDIQFNGSNHGYAIDGYSGTRYVFRYNNVYRCSVELHGTESSGRWRGGRAIEVYENDFHGNSGGSYIVNLRSGTAVIYGNKSTDFITSRIALADYRMFWSFSTWGAADGTNAWDINEAGGPFYNGVASSVGSLTVTVSGAGWTTNQWYGYSIKRTLGGFSYVESNTSDTITFHSSGGYGSNLSFSVGEAFSLWKTTETIDQPGRVKGSLITGDSPTPPVGWNNQEDEPVYIWDNKRSDGSDVLVSAQQPVIRLDEHYIVGEAKPGYSAYTFPNPLSARPEVPTGIAAVSNGSSSIAISWTDASSNEDGFTVERSLNGTTGWTEIADLPAGTTSYTDSNLYGGTYYYRVAAYNSYGSSAWSNVASATVARLVRRVGSRLKLKAFA